MTEGATDPHKRSVDDVVAALATDLHSGLANDEAAARLRRVGRNELPAEPPTPAWRRFLAQFQDILVILLLIATAISAGLWIYERETALPYEALAIFAVVLLNAAMGFIQESRAEAAVAALQSMSADTATVIRGAERRRLPAAELVPGDLEVFSKAALRLPTRFSRIKKIWLSAFFARGPRQTECSLKRKTTRAKSLPRF